MDKNNLFWTRAKRYVKLWLRDAVNETIAPLTDANARLNYIGILVVLLLFFPLWNQSKQSSWWTKTIEGAVLFICSIPLFFLINLIFAIFRVQKKEKELGQWFGHRFIYNEPQLLFTVLVDESDNGKPLTFGIEDAENEVLVSYVIKTDRTDNRAKVELVWPADPRPMFGKPMNLPKGSFRLPSSNKMTLLTHLEPESTVTTVRVFMTSWEVGKGDGKG